jgi:hypothetical protein
MDPLQYKNVKLCHNQDFIIEVGKGPQYLSIDVNFSKLTDSVSTMCGNQDGVTFCGARELIVYDLDVDIEHTLSVTGLFSWDPANSRIIINQIDDYS